MVCLDGGSSPPISTNEKNGLAILFSLVEPLRSGLRSFGTERQATQKCCGKATLFLGSYRLFAIATPFYLWSRSAVVYVPSERGGAQQSSGKMLHHFLLPQP